MGGRTSTQNENNTFDLTSLVAGDEIWSVYWHTDQHSFEEPQIKHLTVKSIEHVSMEKVTEYVPERVVGEANSYEISFTDDEYHGVLFTIVTPPTPELLHSNYANACFKPMYWRTRDEAEQAARAEMTWARNNLIEEREVLDREIAALDRVMGLPFKDYQR